MNPHPGYTYGPPCPDMIWNFIPPAQMAWLSWYGHSPLEFPLLHGKFLSFFECQGSQFMQPTHCVDALVSVNGVIFYVPRCFTCMYIYIKVLDSLELSCGCWEMNPSPLEEDPVLLTSAWAISPVGYSCWWQRPLSPHFSVGAILQGPSWKGVQRIVRGTYISKRVPSAKQNKRSVVRTC